MPVEFDIPKIIARVNRNVDKATIIAAETVVTIARPNVPTDTEALRRSAAVKQGNEKGTAVIEYNTAYAYTQYYGRKGKPLKHVVAGDGTPARIIDNASGIPKGKTRKSRYSFAYRKLRSDGVLEVLPNDGKWMLTTLRNEKNMKRFKSVFAGALASG